MRNEAHPNQEHRLNIDRRRHGNVGRPFRWGRGRRNGPFRGGQRNNRQRNNPPYLQRPLTPQEIQECIDRGLNWGPYPSEIWDNMPPYQQELVRQKRVNGRFTPQQEILAHLRQYQDLGYRTVPNNNGYNGGDRVRFNHDLNGFWRASRNIVSKTGWVVGHTAEYVSMSIAPHLGGDLHTGQLDNVYKKSNSNVWSM